MTNWSNMPTVECPHCGKEFQYDDYYEIEPGDCFPCEHCEKDIFVTAVDTTISAALSTTKDE